jgi:hypothetical protein
LLLYNVAFVSGLLYNVACVCSRDTSNII